MAGVGARHLSRLSGRHVGASPRKGGAYGPGAAGQAASLCSGFDGIRLPLQFGYERQNGPQNRACVYV
jgi:hypothetical protein